MPATTPATLTPLLEAAPVNLGDMAPVPEGMMLATVPVAKPEDRAGAPVGYLGQPGHAEVMPAAAGADGVLYAAGAAEVMAGEAGAAEPAAAPAPVMAGEAGAADEPAPYMAGAAEVCSGEEGASQPGQCEAAAVAGTVV